MIWFVFLVLVIVGALLLRASMKIQQLKMQPPPSFLYGFHEDGTPIKGWHKSMKGKK